MFTTDIMVFILKIVISLNLNFIQIQAYRDFDLINMSEVLGIFERFQRNQSR